MVTLAKYHAGNQCVIGEKKFTQKSRISNKTN